MDRFPDYFEVIRRGDDFTELCSRNTGHFWMIVRSTDGARYPIQLYHKYERRLGFHFQRYGRDLPGTLRYIMAHDRYILGK